MFCPGCGTEERHSGQFCRACGTDMRVVRSAIEKPDTITDSAASARDEIGRAIASRIQQLQTAGDLKKIAEQVLPEIEKFLESPEERRLRRIRAGVITAAVGLGSMILMLITTVPIVPLMWLGWPAGLLVALIGLGIVINGLAFSVPSNRIPNYSQNAYLQNTLDKLPPAVNSVSTPLAEEPQKYLTPPISVTEHTTQQLPNEPLKRPGNTR
jgi:hypothetical protein